MKKYFFPALRVLTAFTLICGLIYPIFIYGIARVFMPQKANGSLILVRGKIIGSELVGQKFTDPKYFLGRPSAIDYNPMPSGGSNLNPTGEALRADVLIRLDTIRKYHGKLTIRQVPKDLIFASASGVDPDISPEAAFFQVDRIARVRNFTNEQKKFLIALIKKETNYPFYGILGNPSINVLKLNLALNHIE